MNLESILSHLQGVKPSAGGFVARCPSHDDKHASLSIGEGHNGGIVIKCHAGCVTADVLAAIGLTLKDLAPVVGSGTPTNTVYRYDNAAGEPVFEVVRTPDKRFWQRLPGSVKPGLGDTQRCLYRIPDLLKAEPSQPIFIVEGEKDVDRLWSVGLAATTSPMGAGKWRQPYTDWLSEHLRDRYFVILPDNDEPGIKHADEVLHSLQHAGLKVREKRLPHLRPHGDVSDWLSNGGSPSELVEIAEAPVSEKIHPLDLKVMDGPQLSLATLSLPEALIPHLLYRGFSTLLAGDSKLGKSSLQLRALLAGACGGWWLDKDRRSENRLEKMRILFINFEDPLFVTRERALRMMAPEGLPENFLTMEPPYGYSLNAVLDWIHSAHDRLGLDAVILDPIGVAAEWNDETDNSEITRTFKAIQRLASETQLAILSAHHVTKKPGEYGLNIRGASAIKANVLGYLVLERQKELFKLAGINKLSGEWDVTLDRTDRDWSWWIVESRSGNTRTPQQSAKEEALALILLLVKNNPLMPTSEIAEHAELKLRTCQNYLHKLKENGLIVGQELTPSEKGGNAEMGWIITPSGTELG